MKRTMPASSSDDGQTLAYAYFEEEPGVVRQPST